MKRWCAFLVAVTIAVELISAGMARAQSDRLLPVTPGAGQYLPSAGAIGEGWSDVSQMGIAPGRDLFREGVKAVYGGPEGSRALVYVRLTKDGETARQSAWDQTAAFFRIKSQQWAAEASSMPANNASTPSPLASCRDVRQAEGVDPETQIAGGLTLCAVDPDVIVLTIVSGELDGGSGVHASDALLQIALEAGTD
jgi:hypothetical protein